MKIIIDNFDDIEFFEEMLRVNFSAYLEKKINDEIEIAKNSWDKWKNDINNYKRSSNYNDLKLSFEIQKKKKAHKRSKLIDEIDLFSKINSLSNDKLC